MDTPEHPALFAISKITQITGTLTMFFTGNPEQDEYEIRLMMRRDASARLAYAYNKGREEGRLEAALVAMLLRVGQRRFGPVPETVRDRLVSITSLEQLDFLTDRLLKIHGWDELFSDIEPTEGVS